MHTCARRPEILQIDQPAAGTGVDPKKRDSQPLGNYWPEQRNIFLHNNFCHQLRKVNSNGMSW